MGFFPLLLHSVAKGHSKSRCMVEIQAFSTFSLSIPQRMTTKSRDWASHWQCFEPLRDLCALKPHFSLLNMLNGIHWSCHVCAAPCTLSRGEGIQCQLNSHFLWESTSISASVPERRAFACRATSLSEEQSMLLSASRVLKLTCLQQPLGLRMVRMQILVKREFWHRNGKIWPLLAWTTPLH